VTDPDELRRLLAQFRAAGYAVDRGFWRDGVCAVGAVVHDASGRTIAALSAMMPEFRLEEAGVEDLGRLVLDVAERASERLGHRGSKPVNPAV
jgi:DNA-binding IclR family transcriptional regulator